MGTITEIKAQRKKGRSSVYVDGAFVCGMDDFTLYKNRLAVGKEVATDELERMQSESEALTATDRAMGYAAERARSEKQMRDYLKEKGYLPALIEDIVGKLKEYGYVNDAKFAASYVAYHAEDMGINKIRAYLAQLGIDSEYIDEAMAGVESQETACEKYALKYLRSHKNATYPKLCAHLYAKGFTRTDIYKAAAKVWEGESDDTDF